MKILSSKLIMPGEQLLIYKIENNSVQAGFNDEQAEVHEITVRQDGRKQFQKECMTFILNGAEITEVLLENGPYKE